MAYNYQNFLRPIFPGTKNIQILDSDGDIKWTINPFFIVNTLVNNNLVKINLKNDKIIILDFNNSDESKSAISNLQSQIDLLVQNIPIAIDKNIENFLRIQKALGVTISTSPYEIDFNEGNTKYLNSLGTNFQVDFINIPTIPDTIIKYTLLLNQGLTPYMITDLTINGGITQSIKWFGGPTANSICVDVISLSFIFGNNGALQHVLAKSETFSE